MSNPLNLIIYGSLTIAFVITLFGIEETVKGLEKRTKRMELYLDLILDKLEISPPELMSEQVKELALNPETKIAAIKLYRQETGARLKEAKEDIEIFILEYKRHNR